jgi:hypothetical protein
MLNGWAWSAPRARSSRSVIVESFGAMPVVASLPTLGSVNALRQGESQK